MPRGAWALADTARGGALRRLRPANTTAGGLYAGIPTLHIFTKNKRSHRMKRCKITILKTTLDEELAKEYAAPGFTRCPMMREGQVFYADYAKPEGFCDEAWKAVYQYVFALSHGAGVFYYGDWIDRKGVAICSCNDGLRPVIMKIERTDEESYIDYEPVER